jgi:4-amino-4-deoxy-L-arabinose transferase-like glycosyltransferase
MQNTPGMASVDFFRAPAGWLSRWIDALTDPLRRERAVLTLLAAYVALWTVYGVIAKSSQDLHFDMTELVAWAREPAFGYPKHPPLASMVVRLWFAIFPLADWSYYLFAIVVAAATLWVVWRLAGDYLDAEKRVLALAVLMLVPFFNFHALKFNVNSLLPLMWGLTAFFFFRSYERRSLIYAALAGIAAGGAMLCKYWSGFLVVGLALAVLLDPRRRDYFRSPVPYVTVLFGALIVTPHVVWLFANNFPPFTYAVTQHPGEGYGVAALSALGYLGGSLGYAALPILLVLALVRPDPAVLKDVLLPAGAQRRMPAVAFWTELILPALVAVILGLRIDPLWSSPAFALLPVVLLSPPGLEVTRRASSSVLGVALVLPIVMILSAPFIAVSIHGSPLRDAQEHARLLAGEVEKQWAQTSATPLRLVGGPDDLAYGVAFYAADKPSAFSGLSTADSPWVDAERIRREGLAIVCPTEGICRSAAEVLVRARPDVHRSEVTLTRRYLGRDGDSRRYLIFTIPPAS